MKSKFREAKTWFCPNGHNVFTTTQRHPECGACGVEMITDPEAFGDAIEAVERAGIARVERELARKGPKPA